jgi:phage-related tail protein
MNPQPNPDERFDQVESTLNRLANSQRHLLTAQVLMNERMDRSERAIQNLAEQTLKLAGTVQALADKVETLADKVEALADGQKHTDSKLDALADIVRQWIERNGNGGGRHSAS